MDDFASELDHKRAPLAERFATKWFSGLCYCHHQGQLKEMQVEKGKLFQVDTGKISELRNKK